MEDKNKKQESAPATAQNIEYVVMPKEFRKAAPKKINPKIFIIGGAILALAGISIAAVLLLTPKPQVVIEPPPEVTPQEPPPEAATSTPDMGSSLLEPVLPEVTPEPVVTLSEVPGEKLTQGADSDADGLSDKEEVIFQTDATRPDTDGDGFLDGNEIFHLYNPAAPPPVTLLESGIVKIYRNGSFGYTVYYPTLWSTSSTIDMSKVSFISEETESADIIIEDMDANGNLRNWYAQKFPTNDVNSLQSYVSKQGLDGLQDAERLNTYFKKGNKVFIVTYNLGGTNTTWYRALYGMILNSLKIE